MARDQRESRIRRPVFGSSTSGLLPSVMQEGMTHPERLVVGHPFNPVYLMPLVEICGGALTSDATKRRAAEVYDAIGMRPLHLDVEIDGFVADRLMEALWREALWLVNDGVATAEEIDDAMRFGPGLRWSFMGTFLIYRIAGGEPGMRHFMAHDHRHFVVGQLKLLEDAVIKSNLAPRHAKRVDLVRADRLGEGVEGIECYSSVDRVGVDHVSRSPGAER